MEKKLFYTLYANEIALIILLLFINFVVVFAFLDRSMITVSHILSAAILTPFHIFIFELISSSYESI